MTDAELLSRLEEIRKWFNFMGHQYLNDDMNKIILKFKTLIVPSADSYAPMGQLEDIGYRQNKKMDYKMNDKELPEWVSIKDRLPTQTKRYAVVHASDVNAYNDDRLGYSTFWAETKEFNHDNITHWLELPSIPDAPIPESKKEKCLSLLRDFVRVMDSNLEIQPGSALHRCASELLKELGE